MEMHRQVGRQVSGVFITFIKCLKGNKSLCILQVVVTNRQSKGQGHLLSCSGQLKIVSRKNSQNGSILQENLISTNPIEPYFLQWPINRVQNVSTGLHKKILTQQTYPRFFPEMFPAFLIRAGGYVPIKGVLIREDRGEFCPRGQRQRQSQKKLVSHS